MSGVTSHGYLLELVQVSGGLSRQQLIAETGMSRGTLYARLDALLRLGLVYEAESLGSTGGRRARRIRFEDRGRIVLAVDLGHSHARVSVTDLLGRELRRAEHPLRFDDGPDVLGPVLEHAVTLLAGAGGTGTGQAEQLVGVGVGVPAAVDPATGAVLRPGWPADAVHAAVAARWGCPVVVENDARAAALGECRSAEETLVYVKFATGIGCGVVVGGDVLRGAGGVAGAIGHVQVSGVDPAGPRCRCGRTGCLATYSSGRALLERLGTHLDRRGESSLDGIVAAAAEADPVVTAELEASADVLGVALATIVTAVNPHRLVLGGTLGVLPAVVQRVRTRVDEIVVERARPVVEGGTGNGRATVRGLARLVRRRVYAPSAVDAMVADSG